MGENVPRSTSIARILIQQGVPVGGGCQVLIVICVIELWSVERPGQWLGLWAVEVADGGCICFMLPKNKGASLEANTSTLDKASIAATSYLIRTWMLLENFCLILPDSVHRDTLSNNVMH